MSAQCLSNSQGLAVPLLETLDCELNRYVAGSFETLFGQAGWLAPVLTSALTIYVVFFAFSLMTGRGGLSLSGLLPRLAVIALALTFITRWGAYQTVLVDLLFDGAGEIAAQMVGGDDVPVRLDATLNRLTILAGSEKGLAGLGETVRPRTVREAAKAAKPISEEQPVPARASRSAISETNIIWISAGILAFGSIGLLVLSKVLLAVLLAVGPLFMVCALFGATRGLFEGWLKTATLYALVPLFTLVLTAGALQIIDPLSMAIAEARRFGGADSRAVLMLAAVSALFAAILFQVFRLASGLTSCWRLPVGQLGASNASRGESVLQPSTQTDRAMSDTRVVQLVGSIGRNSDSPSVHVMSTRRETMPDQMIHQQMVRPARRPLGQSLRLNNGPNATVGGPK